MSGHHDRTSGSLASASIATAPDSPRHALTANALPGDPRSDVLRTVKLNAALFFVVDASSPWSIAVPHTRAFAELILPRAQHVVSYHIATRGHGWIGLPGEAPVGSRRVTCS